MRSILRGRGVRLVVFENTSDGVDNDGVEVFAKFDLPAMKNMRKPEARASLRQFVDELTTLIDELEATYGKGVKNELE